MQNYMLNADNTKGLQVCEAAIAFSFIAGENAF